MEYMVGAFKTQKITHASASQNAVGNAIYSVVRYCPHDLSKDLVFPAVKGPLRGTKHDAEPDSRRAMIKICSWP